MTTKRKSYSELIKLETFDERLDYLQTRSSIGVSTFGAGRYLNQILYTSPEWRMLRDAVIIRDNGCDLGVLDCPLNSNEHGTIHHINPITVDQVINRDPEIFDLENLILCSGNTHRRIHYDKSSSSDRQPVERRPNDTCPWKVNKNDR